MNVQLIPVPAVTVPASGNTRREQILQLAENAFLAGGRAKLTLGACLKEIRDERYWEAGGGYKSFEHYGYSIFGYAPSTLSALIQVYSLFIESFQKNPDSIQHVGWAKLAMLAPIVTQENVDQLLTLAEAYTQAELRKHIKNLQGQHETEVKDSKGTKFTFQVATEQAEIVREALGMAEELNGTTTPGMTLEAIMADYLISHQSDTGVDYLELVISTIERIYDIRITYTRNGDVDSN